MLKISILSCFFFINIIKQADVDLGEESSEKYDEVWELYDSLCKNDYFTQENQESNINMNDINLQIDRYLYINPNTSKPAIFSDINSNSLDLDTEFLNKFIEEFTADDNIDSNNASSDDYSINLVDEIYQQISQNIDFIQDTSKPIFTKPFYIEKKDKVNNENISKNVVLSNVENHLKKSTDELVNRKCLNTSASKSHAKLNNADNDINHKNTQKELKDSLTNDENNEEQVTCVNELSTFFSLYNPDKPILIIDNDVKENNLQKTNFSDKEQIEICIQCNKNKIAERFDRKINKDDLCRECLKKNQEETEFKCITCGKEKYGQRRFIEDDNGYRCITCVIKTKRYKCNGCRKIINGQTYIHPETKLDIYKKCYKHTKKLKCKKCKHLFKSRMKNNRRTACRICLCT